MDIYGKRFYIVDCDNFIFYPKVVKAIGLEISPDELSIITDNIDNITNENIQYSIEYLEYFKSFEEAKKEAERLNNILENKERADKWNNPEAVYKRKLWEEDIKRNFRNIRSNKKYQ